MKGNEKKMKQSSRNSLFIQSSNINAGPLTCSTNHTQNLPRQTINTWRKFANYRYKYIKELLNRHLEAEQCYLT